MVQPVNKAAHTPAKAYTPVTFSTPGKKPIVISFPKGTDLAVDEKSYSLTKPTSLTLDAKHYEALLKADVNKDKKIDKEDAVKFLAKGGPKGVTATPFGVNVDTNGSGTKRIGAFFPGYVKYNQTHASE